MSTPAALVPSLPVVAKIILQPPLIGSLFAMLVYGITCLQTFFYFQTYPHDPIFMKLTVALIWILETVHTGFMISFLNFYLIEGFGNSLVANSVNWDLLANLITGFGVLYTVNLYYTWRSWKLSRNCAVGVLLAVLASVRLAFGIVAAAFCFPYGRTWQTTRQHILWGITSTLALGTVEDTLAACIVAYYLYTGRSGMNSTNHIVGRLLAYTMATGALTALFEAIELVLFLVYPNNILYLGLVLVQTKLYANSLLMSLNLRKTLTKRKRFTIGPGAIGMNNLHLPATLNPGQSSDGQSSDMNILVLGRDVKPTNISHEFSESSPSSTIARDESESGQNDSF
ncbi:hypothetical protein HYDPIDRAFT_28237 [Hydnomerulius pinastri MD-312]|uniref:DUF6534 domain-containing protein n=1 Tax=Hydnomerulius pinastri MD-312 TaxID=994086 RepID=A0A0C9WAC3_9AGAM|nr:hypothetical protein HYDPIDRAFT_28237 [Hydnomerulius pinastri MD-312]